MQTGNGQESKVISLTERGESKSIGNKEEKPENFTWEETMRRNEENKARMKKEREKANHGVIRSYRLKH